MKKFKDKVVVITGGAGGIGKSTASAFLEEGASVVLVDVDQEELDKVEKELDSGRVLCVQSDVSRPEDVKKYVDATVEKFGRIDVFFNNAGIEGVVKPIAEYPVETFDKVFAVNVRGAWLGLKYVIPVMTKNGNGGSIIITSSVAGLTGTANVSAYIGSKHALVGIMKSTALEMAPHNIRVNAINPAPVNNRMMRSLEKGFAGDGADKAREQFEQMIPLGRYAENEEIAALVLFLADERSSFITGSTYRIDGGMLSD